VAIAFRGTASGSGVNSASATIPASVQPGDALTLIADVNQDATIAAPSGWQVASPQEQPEAGGVTAAVFKRVAQAGDAGSLVTVTNDGPAGTKAQALLIAHSGTDQVDPVHAIDSTLHTATQATHTTPTINTVLADCWVIEVCCAKSTAGTTFTAIPAGSTSRLQLIGTGGGHVDAAIVDRGPVAPGAYGGGSFTDDASGPSAITYTIALSPKTNTQTLRPQTDITVGSYTAVPTPGAGVALASRIGEAIRDDATFVQSPNGAAGAVYETRVAAGLDPLSSTGHKVTVVLSSAGGATTASCTVSLVQGTTVIADETFTNVPEEETVYEYTLTSGEADAITDYANLRLRFAWTVS
jgi:hypothetical protein